MAHLGNCRVDVIGHVEDAKAAIAEARAILINVSERCRGVRAAGDAERDLGSRDQLQLADFVQQAWIGQRLCLETGFPVDPYPIDSTEVFGTPLCLTDWIMYYPCCLGKRFLTTPLQVLVFWSYRLFILPDHCLHAPGQQQPCGD